MSKSKQIGFIATVKLGPKGQIVIPKEAREMFDVGPGDSLVLMAHPKRGIALQKQSLMLKIADAIINGDQKLFDLDEQLEDQNNFAQAIRSAIEEETQ